MNKIKSAKISFPNSPFLKSGRQDPFLEFLKKEKLDIEVKEEIEDADYLFLYPNHLNEMVKICKNNKGKILVFITSESLAPDFNLVDYAIGYDPLSFGDRYCQFNYQAQLFDYSLMDNVVPATLQQKTRFCNFLYSNPDSHKNRDLFFHKLSQYKKVDSLGSYLRNVTYTVSKRHSENFFMESVHEKKPYKFSIAFENACHTGYNTEKIISSMLANTIPIYWGDNEIDKYYNPESFINCHDYENFDQVVQKVIELDQDDEKYLDVLRKRWKTDDQIQLLQTQKDNLIEFLNHIFSQPIHKANRKPMGTFNDFYSKHLFSCRYKWDELYKKLHRWGHLVKKRILRKNY